MGGANSGRTGGGPTAESSLKIDLAWMMRNGLAKPGSLVCGTLDWARNGARIGSIGYEADMRVAAQSVLRLSYSCGSGSGRAQVEQAIRLTYTEPNYGGRRWWMVCPNRGDRCAKLYLPPGGDRFAGRKAFRLDYRIQRVAHEDRPLERLFNLQLKLGGKPGLGNLPLRPKGMWWRTYERHLERYRALEGEAVAGAWLVVERLRGAVSG